MWSAWAWIVVETCIFKRTQFAVEQSFSSIKKFIKGYISSTTVLLSGTRRNCILTGYYPLPLHQGDNRFTYLQRVWQRGRHFQAFCLSLCFTCLRLIGKGFTTSNTMKKWSEDNSNFIVSSRWQDEHDAIKNTSKTNKFNYCSYFEIYENSFGHEVYKINPCEIFYGM